MNMRLLNRYSKRTQRKRRLQAFLMGMGSVLDIQPATTVHKYRLDKRSIAESMQDYWLAVRADIQQAYNEVIGKPNSLQWVVKQNPQSSTLKPMKKVSSCPNHGSTK